MEHILKNVCNNLAPNSKTLYTVFMTKNIETIVLAGGCFWGMQGLFDQKVGVVASRVGYAGGGDTAVGYEQVKTGETGHAEAIEIVYDLSQTTLRSILATFFQIHDPTTDNRQGNDGGTQYRSAIFYTNDTQKLDSLKAISDADATGLWGNKIITQVTPHSTFVEAETVHQKYLEQNPNGYTCHFPRAKWILPE